MVVGACREAPVKAADPSPLMAAINKAKRDAEKARDLALWREAGGLRQGGEFREALSVTRYGLAMARQRPTYTNWFRGLAADLHHRLGEREQAHAAIDLLEAGLDNPDSSVRINAQALRALLYADAHDHGVAEREAEEALRRATRVAASASKPSFMQDNVRRNLIDVYARTSNSAKSLRILDGFMAERERFERYPALEGFYLLATAVAVMQAGERVAAGKDVRDLLGRARRVFVHVGDTELELRAGLTLARFLLGEGLVVEALAELEQLGPRVSRDHGDRIDENEVDYEALRALCERKLNVELSSRVEVLRRLRELYAELLRFRKRAPQAERGVGLLLFDGHRNLLNELCRHEMLAAPGRPGWEAAIAHCVNYQDHGSLAQRFELDQGATFAALRESLPAGHGVVLYLPGANPESLVFAVDRDHVATGDVASEDLIRDLRRGFVRNLASGLAADPARRSELASRREALGRRLSGALLPPAIAERVSAWTRVTVVGASEFEFVPFEWLPLGDERFLGANRAIDYGPTLSTWLQLRRRDEPFATDYVLMSDIEPADSLLGVRPKLAAVILGRTDRRELLESMAPSSTGVGLGSDRARFIGGMPADPEAIARELAGGCRVLQIIAHGHFNFQWSRPSGIVLESSVLRPDGVLRCADIEALQVAAGLVILSTCDSGVAERLRGDPHSNDLSGAWLVAGARAVLAAHSTLTVGGVLDSSRQWLDALHQPGCSPAEALRLDRAALERLHGLEAPYQRGLVRLVGDGHRPLF